MLVSHSHKFIFIKTKKTAGSSIQDYLARFCKSGIVEKYIPGGHRSAESTRRKVGDKIWNDYLKICPVRNPWDLTVSYYFWRRRDRSVFHRIKRFLKGKTPRDPSSKMTFREFIFWMKETRELNVNKAVMSVDNEWPDYFFIRFENIKEDLEALSEKLGVPFYPEKLPHLKQSKRKDKKYQTFYDDETREIVRESFAREVEQFGYQF